MKNCQWCKSKGKLIQEKVNRNGKKIDGFRIECKKKSCGAAIYLVDEPMWFESELAATEAWDKAN